MRIGEVVIIKSKNKCRCDRPKISVTSQKPGRVQSMCSQQSLTPDTCYLLTLTSLPASVTLIYSTFSLAWTGAVNIVITLLPALVQYHQPPATSHEAVVYECSSDPFNKNIFII